MTFENDLKRPSLPSREKHHQILVGQLTQIEVAGKTRSPYHSHNAYAPGMLTGSTSRHQLHTLDIAPLPTVERTVGRRLRRPTRRGRWPWLGTLRNSSL
jgi:hypothetical protein